MSTKVCLMCNQSGMVHDVLELGEIYTHKNINAHNFCLLLSSNLMQRGGDKDGILGFMDVDIKTEAARARRLNCVYCQKPGASIGCCNKSCRRSFHLPCAITKNCRFEFTDTFQSFCHQHHGIVTLKPEFCKSDDLCAICLDKMGEYNPVRSIPSPCCNTDAWYHKRCLLQLAQTAGYFFKYPLCNNDNKFRRKVQLQGIFIPDKDAAWETEEAESNTFYTFSRHTKRPTECVAQPCKCPQGPKRYTKSKNSKFSLIFCEYFVVRMAFIEVAGGQKKVFLCKECETIANKFEKKDGTDAEQNSSLTKIDGERENSLSSSQISNCSNENNSIEICDSNSYGSSSVHSNTSTISTTDIENILHIQAASSVNSSFSNFYDCDDNHIEIFIDLTNNDSENGCSFPQTPYLSPSKQRGNHINESCQQSEHETKIHDYDNDDDGHEIVPEKKKKKKKEEEEESRKCLYKETNQSENSADDKDKVVQPIMSNLNKSHCSVYASNAFDCAVNDDNVNIDKDDDQIKPVTRYFAIFNRNNT